MARILIIEDEPLIAMMLRDWLGELAHETVGPVGSVEDAIALIESSQLDAALLDLHLRGVLAIAVGECLQRRKVPFAVATGDTPAAPMDLFAGLPRLAKPYDFQSVESAIASLLRRA